MTTSAADRATSWFLDGTTGWGKGKADGIVVGRQLSLATTPDGPLSLAADGSLGGLRLPPRLAVDGRGCVYLLRVARSEVLRFDAGLSRFDPLPTIGGWVDDDRGLRSPTAIAVAGDTLFVVDTGSRRVLAFDLRSLTLLEAWGPALDEDQGARATAPDAWRPLAIACHEDRLYVLDGEHGRVYLARGGQRPQLLSSIVVEPGACSAIAVDRDGRVYLLADGPPTRLLIREPDGTDPGDATDADAVRDRFDPPPLRLDHHGRLRLPGRHGSPPAAQLAFDLDGRRLEIDPYEPAGPRSFVRHGLWTSKPLDSGIVGCQWHRIEVEVPSLPEGSSVTIRTYAAEEIGHEPIPPAYWMTVPAIRGATQPPDKATTAADPRHDVLVQSRQGRYLILQVELESDGYDTPRVDWLRVHYPRQSYADDLPAVFSGDEDSRSFLERFLSIFQTEWDRIEATVASSARYADPAAVPDDGSLAFLAQWFALPLEGTWDTARRRRLLTAIRSFYPRRGTAAGLREFLAVYLENIAGINDPGSSFPAIVEGFSERQYLVLAEDGNAPASPMPLWGPDAVGRLQLGADMREGEVRLVSTGDPARDVFHEYAHRFRVFVPSAWISTAGDEEMLRRAIEAEKPAHTQYQLSLVEPRFRIGIQSMVGVDTVIGDYPVARLARSDDAPPPGRQPTGRLGYDTVLGEAPAPGPGLRLTSAAHLGTNTSLG